MLFVGYESDGMRATFYCAPADAQSEWFSLLRRTLEDKTREVSLREAHSLAVPWWSFLAVRTEVLQIIRGYHVEYQISPAARAQLESARTRQGAYETARSSKPRVGSELTSQLESLGFSRRLTEAQLRNVCRLSTLPAAATFSVPGAGKTTEALANYFVQREEDDLLLVIAPKNAFGAWEEQLDECVGDRYGEFVRLQGGLDRIEAQLRLKPRFSLITYQQLTRVAELVASFVATNRTFVYLDESHRIKSGVGRATADAVLRLSHLPVRKLIMSGTPMPQAKDDLLPQFSFLYPEITADRDSIVDYLRPIYVRTTKGELGLLEPQRILVEVEMNEAQEKLYNLMKYEVARQADQTLSIRSRQSFRELGRSIIRLLQVVSNPALLAKELAFAHEGLLMDALAEGDSPKVAKAIARARELASVGKKTIIWTTFRENVEVIAQRLTDLRAVYIHGLVGTGDEDDQDTREGRIRTFHDDKHSFVMVANPAAAAEGISLHRVCQNAIYVDRTYNAAHYLQSEDRIHRLGLRPDQRPTIEILECAGTIDESVRMRLGAKVRAMAEVLEDRSLRIDPIRLDQFEIDDEIEGEVGELDVNDIQSLLDSIRSERP